MKIYATADLHGAQHRVNEALTAIEKHKPDIIIIAGDITQFGPADAAKNILNQFPGPVYTLPGNIDTSDVWEGIKETDAVNLHKKQTQVNGLTFAGVNGVDDGETELFFTDETLNGYVKHADVLVTHVPPYGFQDTVFLGKHAGSKPVRRIVDKFHPLLVISGHIHEKPGFIKHENTVIVNCSMGKRGRGAIIHINETVDVTMLD
ncbi:MAG: metallophosphoesterase [Candidatus Thermoplasmatota archaeon]|nr:metallophosphoesterase [Candidatus Thermoplasmatota archaeon]